MIVQDLKSLCDHIENNKHIDTVWLIFVAENTNIAIEAIINWANKNDIQIAGAICPAIIFENQSYTSGILVKSIPTPYQIFNVKKLDTISPVFSYEIITLVQKSASKLTLLTMVDGLSSQISAYLSKLFEHLGSTVNYVGGGAGSISLQQQPCIFTNEGFFQDAAFIVLTPLNSKLGVQHGWLEEQGPFVVSKSSKNIIEELNWQKAFEVYKSVVNTVSDKSIHLNNFFEVAQAFPFGLKNEIGEDIVRDPIYFTKNGGLVCVGEVPENTMVNILKGDKDSLIKAAGKAVLDCLLTAGSPIDNLLISCISRKLYHEKDFPEELAEIQQQLAIVFPNTMLEGILTLGELSSYGDGYLHFFNKTVVNCLLYQY